MADLSDAPARVRVAWSTGSSRPEAADLLLQLEVGTAAGIPVSEVRVGRLCPRCGSSDHGRPLVVRRDGRPVPHVSLSRAGDTVVVAVSDAGSVGVDLERPDAARFSGFADVALHAAEAAPDIEQRAVTWVRKESLVKATGDGLAVDLRRIRVSDPGQTPRLLEWSGRSEMPSVHMVDLDIPGHAGCVTLLAAEAPVVTSRQVAPGALSA